MDEDGLLLLAVEATLSGRLETLDDGLGRRKIVAVGSGDDDVGLSGVLLEGVEIGEGSCDGKEEVGAERVSASS